MPPMHISLAGDWDFRFDDQSDWYSLAVPGCWETPEGRKDRSGPAWYRTSLAIPAEAHDRRIRLVFSGISYACEIFLDGQLVGEHIGLWDAFDVDLTSSAQPGATHELLIKVEKPAGLVAGPDSASLPGRFPLRSTLAGFLPYVWGHIFGGIWQDVQLVIDGPATLVSAKVRGLPDGQIRAEIVCAGPPAALTIEIIDAHSSILHRQLLDLGDGHSDAPIVIEHTLAQPEAWFPETPVCYTMRVQLGQDDARDLRFGLRSLHVDGTAILLNNRPIYPRMALSWGWYSDILHCNPGPERIRSEFSKLKALGYNGIKLCLWIPPQEYFDLADELGMLLWVELPMWLPQPDAHFYQQVPLEYERIVCQVCNHPSIILYSLGCELNRAVGPDLLAPLYSMVKQLAGDALVRDNSGSGEAYGGLLNEYADYYDYHFYSDIHFFRNLIDYFTPRWRPAQPWVFGEFCDLDTFRDNQKLIDPGTPEPWWLSSDPTINPQGARWQFDVPFYQQRLEEIGLWERSAEFERLSYAHALLHRKWTIETVRSYQEIAGYVITGEVDTPISTAGMWDDFGNLKFAAKDFRAFNQNLVLTLGWDKRRDWVNGGDRAAYWDTWNYRAGSTIRPHLIISHYGAAHDQAQVSWSVAFDGEAPFAANQSRTSLCIAPGSVREVTVAEFVVPELASPRQATFSAALSIDQEQTENSWPLWLFPASPWKLGLDTVGLVDPRNILAGIERLISGLKPIDLSDPQALARMPVIITTIWTAAIDQYVSSGGRAVLLEQGQEQSGPLPTVELPFWREALRIAEPHPSWGDFPHHGWADMQFFGCATDRALDLAQVPAAVPILRRVDVRSMASHAYIAELPYGQGRLIDSTLRIQGGQGEQPIGVARNIGAAYLLSRLVRSLTGNML